MRWTILQRLGAASGIGDRRRSRSPISRQAVARDIDLLRQAGLIESERHGREVSYRAIGARTSALAMHATPTATLISR